MNEVRSDYTIIGACLDETKLLKSQGVSGSGKQTWWYRVESDPLTSRDKITAEHLIYSQKHSKAKEESR
ncbi:hypothetical protein Tco_1152855 [Tanacetum coccineum]